MKLRPDMFGPQGNEEELTEFELQVLLQLVQLLGEFAQHGAQEGDVLVLLGQSQLHLVEPEVSPHQRQLREASSRSKTSCVRQSE